MKNIDWKQDLRKLKPTKYRRPVDVMSIAKAILEVSRETEFKKDDVDLVIRAFLKKIELSLLDSKTVKLPRIGTIFPMVKRERPGVALNGGKNFKKVIVPAMWVLRFMPSKQAAISLKKIKVLQDDIDNLYYDN